MSTDPRWRTPDSQIADSAWNTRNAVLRYVRPGEIRDPNLPMTSDCAPTGITTLNSWLNDNGHVLGRRYVSELRRNYRR